MLFSIIIPTYSSSKTIEACLNSVQLQTFKNFEVIVIDGLSTDDTLQITKKFEDKLNLLIFTEKDNGIYDAMNKGILKANGDYLYFLGSDDTLFKNNILALVASEIAQNNAEIIYGNVKMIGKSNSAKNDLIYGNQFNLKRLIEHNIPHQAIFYHKKVFKTLGLYQTYYKLFADHDFNLKAFSIFKFHYIDLVIANFALGGSSSTENDDKFNQDKIRNFIAYYATKIHKNHFINIRYYLKEAALNAKHRVSFLMRIYCLMIYAKHKLKSLLN
ncbi:MAG: glycosyltransferase family 2 protein [Bacteroidota bacterium]